MTDQDNVVRISLEPFIEDAVAKVNARVEQLTEEQLVNTLEHLGYTVFKPGSADDGDVSDGHHTFNELYQYRMLYNVHAALGWLAAGIPVSKSWRHSDGELCFGGGWFVVVAQLPTGQVSNHYTVEHWDLFDIPQVDLSPEYDGHTPKIAADRLWWAARIIRNKAKEAE